VGQVGQVGDIGIHPIHRRTPADWLSRLT